VSGSAATYGESPAMVADYAKKLAIPYSRANISGRGRRWVCETEILPGYTERAKEFQKHVFAPGAYAIYSGAAHAELYAVSQAWRPSAEVPNRWERTPIER
jgi:hypothetical protein